jgi:signal transduction histidine kinase
MATPAKPQESVAQWTSPLLPAELREPGGNRRSVRDWLVDLTMLGIAVLVSAIVLGETLDQHSEPALAADLIAGAIALVSLWWRRSHPVMVAPAAVGPSVIGLFNAAIRAPRIALAAIAAVGLAGSVVYPLIHPDGSSYAIQLILGVLVIVVVIGWGLFVRARRELVHSLRERAERVESEQRLRVEQARDAERRRIAREMHDVLAHRVSLLSLHAGALEFRPDAPPEEIAEAAGVIRASAHSALQELREVIGVLRDGREEGTERPQPTLCDVPALVEESRAAGMKVECRIDANGDVPEGVGRTAYRIVQEGLTNARKHAPAAAVSVSITSGAGPRLDVAVVSRDAVGPRPEAPPGAGTGLIGLAERVALAGGEFRHGRDASGDFALRATLPWSAS